MNKNVVINQNCPCKNLRCKIHGNCVECRKRHNSFLIKKIFRQKPACDKLNERNI